MDIMRLLPTIVLSLLLATGYAQSDKQFVIKGNEFYKKGEYDKAAEQYQQALSKNDKNVEARYNLGNALYKSKKAEEAQKAFEGAAEVAGDRNMKARSTYNKGVVLTRDNKLKESIEAYKQSLRQNSTDEEARENLQKAINELKKQDEQKQKDNKDKKNNQDQNKDQQDQQQNKSKLNKKQAEQMLNAVRQEEKKQMQDKQKARTKAGGSPDKDW